MRMLKKYTCLLLYSCLFALVAFACDGKNKEMSYFHKVDPVISIYASFSDGNQQFTTSQRAPFGNTIAIDFPYYYPEDGDKAIDVSRMKLSIEFNDEIKVLTTIPNEVDLTKPFNIDIVNADGTKEQVTIESNIRKSNAARITYFALPGVNEFGLIVESIKKIGINKEGKDLSNLIPEIRVSASATIYPDPTLPQNFNNPVEYTVTAQDGSVVKYMVDDIKTLNAFDISKGVNIASWLSTPKYSGAQRAAFFQEADVRLLSQLGFDHVRLCVDEAVLWEENGQKIRSYGFDLLHNAIQWCSKYNMRALVDMHITRNHRFTLAENPLFTDPNEPAKFVKLWEEMSDELSGYPNSLVAYELLNEPCSGDPENWNRVAALAIAAIRKKESDRTIIVGVCTTNSSARYSALKLPQTHKIMMTFHYYGPFLLTYYGAQSTTGGRTDIPIQYPGQLVPDDWISQLPANWQSTGQKIHNKETLRTSIMQGITRAKQLNVPVFVGEFGTWKVTPEPSRSNWYRDVVEILNEEGKTPYTSFDYKGAGYSIVSESNEILYPRLVEILTGK